jgi:melibiose permease/lactose/raffinose/galactose permease
MDIMLVVSAIGYAIMLIPSLLLSKGAATLMGYDLKFVLVTVGYMLANFGQYGFYLIMMISIMNTVEYNELRHATRDEGIISSLRPFITKLASALTVAIANITYITFGILDYTNGIAKQEQLANQGIITSEAKGEAVTQLLSGVQANQSLGLLFVMTVVPCVLMFLSYILYKKFYKLDEEEYDRICGELEARTQDTI